MRTPFHPQAEPPEVEGWEPIAAALRALPVPPRPRGFELTAGQAAALRPVRQARRLPAAPLARRLAAVAAAAAVVGLVSLAWSPWLRPTAGPGQTAGPAMVLTQSSSEAGASQASDAKAPGAMIPCASASPSPAQSPRATGGTASGGVSPRLCGGGGR